MKLWGKRIKIEYRALALLVYTLVTLMIPNFVLLKTEGYDGWSNVANIFMPLGFYMMYIIMFRRVGVSILLLLWAMFFCAFEIAILSLFGNSIVASDMYTNLFTTNPTEASELLSNIAPFVVIIFIIYLPVIIGAIYSAHKYQRITVKMKKIIFFSGLGCFCFGAVALVPAYKRDGGNVFLNNIFPVNTVYNMHLSFYEQAKILNYGNTSRDFTFNAKRTDNPSQREIYVYIIGEAARAASWQLYGYERQTNPCLSKRDDIVVFDNVLTQSNTTHKSVPMLLTSVEARNHDDIYNQKGIISLFKECGFDCYLISNQSPTAGLIDMLTSDDGDTEQLYINSPRYDIQLLTNMKRILDSNPSNDIFFILHCYGSHFSYHQRYPSEFARFVPDDDVSISASNVEYLKNSYDNSILYTDYVLNEIISYIKSTNTCSAVFYSSDHGEDLYDAGLDRFLHASPTVTYFQLHVASLMWFSDSYKERYRNKVEAAANNTHAPATTRSMFHTMADIASIDTPYLNTKVSFVSEDFDYNNPRYYLNDHNEAVHFNSRIGLKKIDQENFELHGIEWPIR